MQKLVVRAAALAAGVVVVFPAGAIASASTAHPVFSAKLSSAREIPQTPSKGSGHAVVTVNGKTNEVCWKLTYRNIGKPVAAFIHRGKAGRTGPPVIPLGGKVAHKGCVISPPNIVKALLHHPTAYYLNIDTKKFLGGAIAGQLRVGK